jgi:hypothetical protein
MEKEGLFDGIIIWNIMQTGRLLMFDKKHNETFLKYDEYDALTVPDSTNRQITNQSWRSTP